MDNIIPIESYWRADGLVYNNPGCYNNWFIETFNLKHKIEFHLADVNPKLEQHNAVIVIILNTWALEFKTPEDKTMFMMRYS